MSPSHACNFGASGSVHRHCTLLFLSPACPCISLHFTYISLASRLHSLSPSPLLFLYCQSFPSYISLRFRSFPLHFHFASFPLHFLQFPFVPLCFPCISPLIPLHFTFPFISSELPGAILFRYPTRPAMLADIANVTPTLVGPC